MGSRYSEDLRLARRLCRVDEEAFEEFFTASLPRLFRFAMNRLRHDEEAAGEVVQASLLKAIDKLGTYRGDAPLFTWLCAICRREIADTYRARNRIASEPPIEESPAVRQALDLLAGKLETPEDELERRELVGLVHTTLDHLPGRYGEALEMRYLEGLPVREIAARLKLGYKAAESVLSRARAAFREGFETVTLAAAGADG